MISYPEDFLKAGYKEYKSESHQLLKMTDILMTKCIRDELGRKFYTTTLGIF